MDVFDLAAKIRLDDEEYESGIEKSKGSFSKLASGVKSGLATVAKVGGAAITAGAAGVAALTKMGVEGYAQYEQLAGGVETLFGAGGQSLRDYAASIGKTVQEAEAEHNKLIQSQAKVFINADNAYKTAGLSANEYMETVTSFSASLIQSLGGDTERAADAADMAITDMSDNANKMGTSMEMIQNAYNGFAKGNFTMLDNLKLGYGGTQEEMKRLLKDAEKISGIKYDISSFADVTEAIHVMQEEMGIAGTTAKEAASTIEGSIGMMKGAWENLVVGIADGNANMEKLLGNFVDSTITMVGNVNPVIRDALMGIGQLVEGLAPIIANTLPNLVSSILPSLLNAAVTLVTSVLGSLPELIESMLPIVIQSALDVLTAFLAVIRENFGTLLQVGMDAILQIVTGFTDSIPEIIDTAMVIIMELVDTLTSPENLGKTLDAAMTLIESIVIGLVENLPKLVDAAILLVENLVDFITEPGNLEKILDMCVRMVITIVNGLVENLPRLVDAAVQLIMRLVEFLLDENNIMLLVNAALDIVLAIVDGLLKASVDLVEGANELIGDLIDEFLNTDWAKVASDIIDSLLSGLKRAWSSVTSWFSGVWNALFDKDVNVDTDKNGNVSVKGSRKYATGLNYVPYDKFPAILHRGEAVLTAAEARAWRRDGIGGTPAPAGSVVINQYIQTVPQTPVEFAAATEAYFEQARWAL